MNIKKKFNSCEHKPIQLIIKTFIFINGSNEKCTKGGTLTQSFNGVKFRLQTFEKKNQMDNF